MNFKNMIVGFEEKAKEFFLEYKTVIFWTLLIAVLTHIYFFAGRYGNEDSLFYISGVPAVPSSGRYFYGGLSVDFAPIIIFALHILEFLISVLLVLSIFKIKNKLYSVIIAGFMVTFPVMGYSFSYVQMYDSYTLALLFSVLAVYVSNKYKYGFLAGGLFCACCLSVYQAYITVSMGLSLILLICELIENDIKTVGKKAGGFLIFGILGFALYNMGAWLLGVEISDYKGLNSAGMIPIDRLPELLERTYTDFIQFFTGKNFGTEITRFFYVPFFIAVVYILFLIFTVYSLKYIVKRKNPKVINKVFILISVLLLPFALNFIDFIGVETESDTLTVYAVVLIFIIPFVILEKYVKNVKNKRGGVQLNASSLKGF